MKTTLLFTLFAFLIHIQATGQENRVALKTGVGIYQGYHLGVDYFYWENGSLGVNIGSRWGMDPAGFYETYGDGSIQNFLVSMEHSFRFGGKVKQGNKAWILGQHFQYYEASFAFREYKVLAIILTIGRQFSISDKFGFSIELGPSSGIELYSKNLYEEGVAEPMVPTHSFVDARIQFVYAL